MKEPSCFPEWHPLAITCRADSKRAGWLVLSPPAALCQSVQSRLGARRVCGRGGIDSGISWLGICCPDRPRSPSARTMGETPLGASIN